MFRFLKGDPATRLRKKYEAKMAEAIELQRSGDIRGFAAKSEEAAELEKQLDALDKNARG